MIIISNVDLLTKLRQIYKQLKQPSKFKKQYSFTLTQLLEPGKDNTMQGYNNIQNLRLNLTSHDDTNLILTYCPVLFVTARGHFFAIVGYFKCLNK